MNNRRGSKRTNRGVARIQQQLNSLRLHVRTEANGRRLRPRPDPPNIVACPWFHVTIQKTIKSGAFNVTTIDDWCQKQIGLTPIKTSLKMLYRFERVRVWAKKSIELQVIALSSEGKDSVAVLRDTEAANHYASVGWEWNAADRGHFFKGNDATNVFGVQTAESAVCYVDVLVRSDAYDTNPELSFVSV